MLSRESRAIMDQLKLKNYQTKIWGRRQGGTEQTSWVKCILTPELNAQWL